MPCKIYSIKSLISIVGHETGQNCEKSLSCSNLSKIDLKFWSETGVMSDENVSARIKISD